MPNFIFQKMSTVNGLLFLSFVCLWHQATCQEQSLMIGLSASTEPTNRESDTTITEGGSFKLCLDPFPGAPSEASGVSVKTKDDTAVAPGDYTALETDLTFTEDEPQCMWFFAHLDVEEEGDEVFTIEATGTSGDYMNYNLQVTVTIRDQDTRGGTISIENGNYPVAESAGEVEVCAAYYGTQPLASGATAQLRTDDNPVIPAQSQASAGSDYTPESGNLMFPAGSISGTRRCVTIKITDDGTDEGEEIFQVLLTAQSGTFGPHTSATVRITDAEVVIAGGGDGGLGSGDDGKGDDGGDGGDNGTPSTGGTGAVGTGGVCSTHNTLSVLLLVLTMALAVLITQ